MYKVIKNLFSVFFFKSVIKMVNLSLRKRVEHFWLKVRIFNISKIKIFDFYLLETVHVTLKYHLLKYSNTPICWQARACCWKLKYIVLNGVVP